MKEKIKKITETLNKSRGIIFICIVFMVLVYSNYTLNQSVDTLHEQLSKEKASSERKLALYRHSETENIFLRCSIKELEEENSQLQNLYDLRVKNNTALRSKKDEIIKTYKTSLSGSSSFIVYGKVILKYRGEEEEHLINKKISAVTPVKNTLPIYYLPWSNFVELVSVELSLFNCETGNLLINYKENTKIQKEGTYIVTLQDGYGIYQCTIDIGGNRYYDGTYCISLW